MRNNLKGIHSAHAKLADGSIKFYWYAWRGPLRGRIGFTGFHRQL